MIFVPFNGGFKNTTSPEVLTSSMGQSWNRLEVQGVFMWGLNSYYFHEKKGGIVIRIP